MKTRIVRIMSKRNGDLRNVLDDLVDEFGPEFVDFGWGACVAMDVLSLVEARSTDPTKAKGLAGYATHTATDMHAKYDYTEEA